MRFGAAISLGTLSLFALGCFNPDESGVDTDSDGTAGTTAASTVATTEQPTTVAMDTGPAESTSGMADDTTSSVDDSDSSSGSGDTGEEIPSWGEGDAPDFGDLGPEGDGNVLVVHALDLDEDVDVWLVGEATPIATGLSPNEASLLQGIPRDARRVVLARAGSLEAVACSDWFPLRADEQWAVVSARDTHTCAEPASGGGSITFEQERPLSGNPLRFAHAGAPDELTVLSGGAAKAGALEPLQTLSVDDLPDCSVAGCILDYQLDNAGLALTRDFTFLAAEVADVPPAGEVLLVALGDLRQEWPTEPDALRLLRIDIDGEVRPIGRDPDLAVISFGVSSDVVFSVPAPPSVFEFATAIPCQFGECAVAAQRFVPGSYDFSASGGGGPANATHTLEAGHRYLLAYTSAASPELTLIEDAFDRSDELVATGRAFNTLDTTLTLGRTFAGNPVEFDAFVNIASLTVTGEQDMPTASWSLLSATDGGALGTGCFYSVGNGTPAGWRGFVGDGFLVGLDSWPPVQAGLPLACS